MPTAIRAASGGNAIGRIIADLQLIDLDSVAGSQAHSQGQYDGDDGAFAGGAAPAKATVNVVQPASYPRQAMQVIIRRRRRPLETGDAAAIIGNR
jgi:hypothetical protein